MLAREEYCKKAQLLLAQAELLRHPEQRTAVLRIAGCYLKLAEHIAKRQDRTMAWRDQKGEPRAPTTTDDLSTYKQAATGEFGKPVKCLSDTRAVPMWPGDTTGDQTIIKQPTNPRHI